VDPTNPVGTSYYRLVAQIDQNGKLHFTETNAYSGNNGRAAIWNNAGGANVVYMAGKGGNSGNPQPVGVIVGTGAQILTPENRELADQAPGTPTPVGSFNITQLPEPADKTGNDPNFRGLTMFNNVFYYTKGIGGNGVQYSVFRGFNWRSVHGHQSGWHSVFRSLFADVHAGVQSQSNCHTGSGADS
jgi:hypothetical protein